MRGSSLPERNRIANLCRKFEIEELPGEVRRRPHDTGRLQVSVHHVSIMKLTQCFQNLKDAGDVDRGILGN